MSSLGVNGVGRRTAGYLILSVMLSAGAGTPAAFAQAAPGATDCSAFHFEIANPSPGLRIDPGDYVLQGIALDKRAEEGAGIERVDFFLGSRDQGGPLIGQAFPAAVDAIEPFGPSSFQTTITVPNITGGRELFGYAHSAIHDQEAIISIPLAVGVEPANAGDLIRSPGVQTCSTSAPLPSVTEVAGVEVQAEAAAEPQDMETAPLEEPVAGDEVAADMQSMEEEAAPAEEEPAAAEPAPLNASARMFFEVGNPSPGDSIHAGDLLVEGMAFDRAADAGHGISRVDVFVDDRNTGGFLVGSAQLNLPNPAPEDPQLSNAGWRARVTIPGNLLGQRTLYFYAQSGVTGGEAVVSVPITVVP